VPREEAIHESLRQDHQDAAIVLSSESTAEVANNHELELRDHVSHNEEEGKPWQGEGDFTSSSRSPKPGINAEIESILGPSPTPISGTMYNKENTSPYTGPPPSPGSKATTPSNRTRKSAKEANGNPKKIERGTKNTKSNSPHTQKRSHPSLSIPAILKKEYEKIKDHGFGRWRDFYTGQQNSHGFDGIVLGSHSFLFTQSSRLRYHLSVLRWTMAFSMTVDWKVSHGRS